MNFDFNAFRPYLAKFFAPIVGAIITGFISYLKARWHIEVDLSSVELNQLVSMLGELVTFAITTGITAVTINKVVNPGNAASKHLATEEKAESNLLKGAQTRTEEMRARARRGTGL
jgi:Mn2+/Fe2+ NRAMP family transporter